MTENDEIKLKKTRVFQKKRKTNEIIRFKLVMQRSLIFTMTIP